MKKILIVLGICALLVLPTASAQTWKELQAEGNSTYLGGFYAATSYACLGTNYTDDSGLWASGNASIPYEKGCAKAIWDSLFAKVDI